MTNDGGLAYQDVMNMTNDKRSRWMKLMQARAEKQKEEMEKARSGKGPR